MPYLKLPKRVFNSPIVKYVNFKDGSFINVIKLNKPYKNGIAFAVYETTSNSFCSNGLFKNYNAAIEKYKLMLENHSTQSQIVEMGALLENYVEPLTYNRL